MKVGKLLRDLTAVPAFVTDYWAFEVGGKVYLQSLARFSGTLFWHIISAEGSVGKPSRVLMLSSGVAKTAEDEKTVKEGPESLLKAIKEKRLAPFDHVDPAKDRRDKEFNILLKGI